MGEYVAASTPLGSPSCGGGPFFFDRSSGGGGAVLSHCVPRRPGVTRGRVGGRALLARLGPLGRGSPRTARAGSLESARLLFRTLWLRIKWRPAFAARAHPPPPGPAQTQLTRSGGALRLSGAIALAYVAVHAANPVEELGLAVQLLVKEWRHGTDRSGGVSA